MRFITPMWHPNSACAQRDAARAAAGGPARTHHPHSALPPSLLRSAATVFTDGKVCISILHPAGVDAMNALETADERWRPILGVEQILVSVIAMLNEPNVSSPANVDAAVQYRDDPRGYRRRVRELVARTLEE